MNTAVLHPEVQQYLRQNIHKTVAEFALKKSPFPKVSPAELAQQLTGLQKAKKKLPTWFKNSDIYYPPKVNLEQTSSEKTAAYKASLVKGENLLDLTGGFGIDDFYFAKNFTSVFHCELNAVLSEIAAHNLHHLGGDNISFKNEDSLDFLKNSKLKFDCIYADPSRRDNFGGKVFQLQDSLPNIPENLELLFSRTETVLIKTAPFLDLKAGIAELKSVAEIHIIAVNNEVKELLWMLRKKGKAHPRIKTLNFTKKAVEAFSSNSNSLGEVNYCLPQNYLFEPNAAIMKGGLFREIATQLKVSKLHPNSHLYTSEKETNFPGRKFQITDFLEYKPGMIKKRFKNSKANITTRNFPESVKVLREKYKIKDGGKTFLFFTTNMYQEKILLVCQKL